MVSGITDIYGNVPGDPEAPPETLFGGPADPRHESLYVDERNPTVLQAWGPPGPYQEEPYRLDTTVGRFTLPGGQAGPDTPYVDVTPRNHAGPWPGGFAGDSSVGPDAIAMRREQSRILHADGFDNRKPDLIVDAPNEGWTEIWNTGPTSKSIEEPTNGQNKYAIGGYGNTNAVTNPDGHNDHDYGNAHLHRRILTTDPDKYRYDWLKPGSRPLVKTVPGVRHQPTGDDSPFAGQDTTRQVNQYDGAVLQTGPASYTPPASPPYGPDLPNTPVQPVRFF